MGKSRTIASYKCLSKESPYCFRLLKPRGYQVFDLEIQKSNFKKPYDITANKYVVVHNFSYDVDNKKKAMKDAEKYVQKNKGRLFK